MLNDGGYSVVRVKATTLLGRSLAHAVQLAGLMLLGVVNLGAVVAIPGQSTLYHNNLEREYW